MNSEYILQCPTKMGVQLTNFKMLSNVIRYFCSGEETMGINVSKLESKRKILEKNKFLKYC